MRPENQDARVRAANKTIEESRKIDSAIILQSDIYNAKTVAAIELRAAIFADTSIPDSEKEHAFTKECERRVIHLQSVIFNKRKELNSDENELRMWQSEGQTSAGKLKEEIRAGFTKFDQNYNPKSPKTIKPAAPAKKRKYVVSMDEVKTVAAQYGLDAFAIKFVAEAQNMTAEQAAKHLTAQRTAKKTN
jgi:hypothetical protein